MQPTSPLCPLDSPDFVLPCGCTFNVTLWRALAKSRRRYQSVISLRELFSYKGMGPPEETQVQLPRTPPTKPYEKSGEGPNHYPTKCRKRLDRAPFRCFALPKNLSKGPPNHFSYGFYSSTLAIC